MHLYPAECTDQVTPDLTSLPRVITVQSVPASDPDQTASDNKNLYILTGHEAMY